LVAIGIEWWKHETDPLIVGRLQPDVLPLWLSASMNIGASISLLALGGFLVGLSHLVEIAWAHYTQQNANKEFW
jgi:hypothetical protein